MTYTEPYIAPKIWKPSDIYTRVPNFLALAKEGYEITEFRPPKTGDVFLCCITQSRVPFRETSRAGKSPRFIVSKVLLSLDTSKFSYQAPPVTPEDLYLKDYLQRPAIREILEKYMITGFRLAQCGDYFLDEKFDEVQYCHGATQTPRLILLPRQRLLIHMLVWE